jgi:hypothetical protein
MMTCEPSISVIFAPARTAIERVMSAPAALSRVATTAHEGLSFHAGGPDCSVKASSATGRCVAAITTVTSAGTSIPGAWQLQKRKRIAVTLHDDLLADGRIQRAVHVRQQQCARLAVAEPTDGQLREPGESVVADTGAGCAHERDPLRKQTAGDEAENLCGRVVEPLPVVHDADEGLLLGNLRKQRQRGEPDQKLDRVASRRSAKNSCQRVALRNGEPVELVQHRRTELMKAAVGQLRL